MTFRSLFAAAAISIAVVVPTGLQAAVIVDARDDIFLAGQSSVPSNFPFNPSGNSVYGSGDLNGAGLLPVAISVFGGESLSLTASGTVSCCYGGGDPNGPNGGGLNPGTNAIIPPYGNVSGYYGPELALVGVFNVGPTPWNIFVVGSADDITVPVGATELYLGEADALGFNDPPGWFNDNTGSFTVEGVSVPEPLTLSLFGAGLAGAAALRRRRKTRVI